MKIFKIILYSAQIIDLKNNYKFKVGIKSQKKTHNCNAEDDVSYPCF